MFCVGALVRHSDSTGELDLGLRRDTEESDSAFGHSKSEKHNKSNESRII